MRFAFVSVLATYEEGEVPLGIACLSAYLKTNLPGIETVWIHGTDPETIFSQLRDWEPDMIGISSTSIYFPILKDVADRARESIPHIPVIWGGYHISMVPTDLPREAVAGVIGEGEITLQELVATYQRTGMLAPDDLAAIAGICFWKGETLSRTAPRELIPVLDDLPMPDWSIFPTGSRPALMSARGCMFRCGFCSSTNFWGLSLRKYTPERVFAEMRQLSEMFPNPLIHFLDDTFADDVKRLERLADLLEATPIPYKDIWGHARAALITPRMLAVLRRLKVIGLSFGFESGSNAVLKTLKSGAATMGMNFRAALRCVQEGIDPHVHFIVGSPTETVADAIQSLNLIYMTPLGFVSINTALPLPGTEFNDYFVANDKSETWQDYELAWADHFKPQIANSMSTEEFVRLRTKLLEQYGDGYKTRGFQRDHLLLGVPWKGDQAATESFLTRLYSVDYGAALHVVVFGVPTEAARHLYRQFPIVIPPLEGDAANPARFLTSWRPAYVGSAWLADGDIPPNREALYAQLDNAPASSDHWISWRGKLEGLNAHLLPKLPC